MGPCARCSRRSLYQGLDPESSNHVPDCTCVNEVTSLHRDHCLFMVLGYWISTYLKIFDCRPRALLTDTIKFIDIILAVP